MKNTANRMKPSVLDIVLSSMKIKGKKIMKSMYFLLIPIFGAWGFIFLAISNGMPATKVKSKILAPITFPRANWGTFLIAELIPTKNSGSEVAVPINTVATMNSDTLMFFAKFVREFIVMLTLLTNTAIAITKIRIFSNNISPL